MIRLDLTMEEAQELNRVLHGYLSNLRMEIADTDLSDFKQQLREEKSEVTSILKKLEEQLPVAA